MHAYLIMAHTDFELLKKLIRMLDDERNDIYIHIDKKVKNVNFDELKQQAKYSKIFYIKRYNIRWAGYSGIQCELELLKAAISKSYEYYHLLSGVDLPLKSQNEIHEFFEQNKGKEFVSYDRSQIEPSVLNRIKYYYFFQDIYGRNRKNPIMVGLYALDKCLEKLQKCMKINRIKDEKICWQKGPNWFSITHDFAQYVIEKEDWIKKFFSFSVSGDEIFLQTILKNSPFSKKVYFNGLRNPYSACLREIDWKRGKPYVWRKIDFKELEESKCMFARKFSTNVDKEIIELIYQKVMENRE